MQLTTLAFCFFFFLKLQRTPLHIAAKHGMTDAVRFLLDEKAEVNSKDRVWMKKCCIVYQTSTHRFSEIIS